MHFFTHLILELWRTSGDKPRLGALLLIIRCKLVTKNALLMTNNGVSAEMVGLFGSYFVTG